MANNLTLAGGSYVAGASGFGQGLSGGPAVTAGNILPSGGFTVEGRITTLSTADTHVAIGSTNTFWIGFSGGNLTAFYGFGNAGATLTGPALTTGVRHYVRLACGPAGGTLWLDGVAVASSTTSLSASGADFSTALGIGGFERTDSFWPTYAWPGEVDEVAVFSGVPASGNFTPPTAPYAGTESGLLALYHLDGNGTDSAGASSGTTTPAAPAAPNVAPNAAGIVYSPYNWQVTGAVATAWNPGAYFRTLFSGASCILNFDVSSNGTPLSQIWWRVDNGPWIAAPVAATITCAIPAITAGNADVPYHRLDVVFKSMDSSGGGLNRWNAPAATAIRFTGLTLDAGSAVVAPGRAPSNVLIYGDSITEGIRTLGEAIGTTPDDNDSMMCWAFELGRLLGAEVGVVGWGGTGYTATFANVPVFGASLASLAQGIARSFAPAPDLIVVNHGTNDGSDVTAPATVAVNALLAACPKSQIALLNPLPKPTNAGLQAAAAGCSAPARVHFVPTSGFLVPAYGIDGYALHPSGPHGVAIIAPKIAAALKPLLSTIPNRWTHFNLASDPTP